MSKHTQQNVFFETTAGEFDSNNNLPVWHHHSYRAELDFQVLRQFLSSGVPGVHCNDECKLWIQAHHITVTETITEVVQLILTHTI